ncbi:hypothetical protein AMTR_s00092p00066500 [Amborella trichopoda]|uniref:Uncharacterized protein n=1 Tax=Amborella trichopoda TaxID=13333 RepID=W1NVB9_AMBTC|nr:hypothetical protein AMTR_s00092p00066500 [Amborella trichopoda]
MKLGQLVNALGKLLANNIVSCLFVKLSRSLWKQQPQKQPQIWDKAGARFDVFEALCNYGTRMRMVSVWKNFRHGSQSKLIVLCRNGTSFCDEEEKAWLVIHFVGEVSVNGRGLFLPSVVPQCYLHGYKRSVVSRYA